MVEVVNDQVFMLLHGNAIANLDKGVLSIDSAGWKTNTTKERLNGLKGVSIHQKAGLWYLNGIVWCGKLTTVNP